MLFRSSLSFSITHPLSLSSAHLPSLNIQVFFSVLSSFHTTPTPIPSTWHVCVCLCVSVCVCVFKGKEGVLNITLLSVRPEVRLEGRATLDLSECVCVCVCACVCDLLG